MMTMTMKDDDDDDEICDGDDDDMMMKDDDDEFDDEDDKEGEDGRIDDKQAFPEMTISVMMIIDW